ncbi:unnamed protein product [Brachionus calyciflorus]|uniref:Ubiquitin-like protease family profile domain-containing protein n=1 Tax=Brachionus calyciflorus TaxID=104777 RepID=A0A813VWN0_9BILA|nr:unnamed protein product [Brachionus calyciflorus]
MLLISEIQVRIWEIVQTRNPVWHFDASGCFLKNIPDQSSPLLYSIVCYDPISRLNIPVADFFACSNDSLSIQLNLLRVKKSFQNYEKFKCPSVIVSDFSWANINGLLRAFLNCDIIQYLKISFKKIVDKDDSYDSFLTPKIYLCATHFLKNVIDKVEEKLKNKSKKKFSEKIKPGYIFCFSVLQNSITFEEFKKHLEDFFNIFSQPKVNQSLMKSLIRMQISISTRKTDWLKDCFQFEERKFLMETDSKKQKEKSKKNVIFTEDVSDNYRRDSPFTKYFDELIFRIKSKIGLDEFATNQNLKDNEYYYPELLDILTTKLHLAPLWSGFLIYTEDINFPNKKQITRFTNKPVEAWFGNFRNNILDINKRLKTKQRLCPSEITIPLYNQLQMYYKEHYDNKADQKALLKIGVHSKKEKDAEEKWSSGRKKSNRLKEVQTTNTKTDCYIVESDEFEDKTIDKFLADQTYFNVLGINLQFREIYQLLNDEIINDQVIDTYLQLIGRDENFFVVNYFYSRRIFEETKFENDFLPHDMNKFEAITGLIYVPEIKHWCFFFADIKKKTFSLLDSLGKNSKKESHYYERWKSFSESRSDLSSIKWTLRKFTHKFQKDAVNCGIFVCMFLDSIRRVRKAEPGGKFTKLQTTDPSEFRFKIYEIFRNGVFDTKIKLCAVCMKPETNKEVLLNFCNMHFYHISTKKMENEIKRSLSDSDSFNSEEEKNKGTTKAFIISNNQKRKDMEENHLFKHEDGSKVFAKFQNSPKVKNTIFDFPFPEVNKQMEETELNFNFQNALNKSFETVQNMSHKFINVVKIVVHHVVERVDMEKTHLSSTPFNRSMELEDIGDIDPIEDPEVMEKIQELFIAFNQKEDECLLLHDQIKRQDENQKTLNDHELETEKLKLKIQELLTAFNQKEDECNLLYGQIKLQNDYQNNLNNQEKEIEELKKFQEKKAKDLQGLITTSEENEENFLKTIRKLKEQINSGMETKLQLDNLKTVISEKEIEIENLKNENSNIKLSVEKRSCQYFECKNYGHTNKKGGNSKKHYTLDNCPLWQKEIDKMRDTEKENIDLCEKLKKSKISLQNAKLSNEVNDADKQTSKQQLKELTFKISTLENEIKNDELIKSNQNIEDLKDKLNLIEKRSDDYSLNKEFEQVNIEALKKQTDEQIEIKETQIKNLQFESENKSQTIENLLKEKEIFTEVSRKDIEAVRNQYESKIDQAEIQKNKDDIKIENLLEHHKELTEENNNLFAKIKFYQKTFLEDANNGQADIDEKDKILKIQNEKLKIIEELHIKVSNLEKNLKTKINEAEEKNSINNTEIDKKISENKELQARLDDVEKFLLDAQNNNINQTRFLKETEKNYSNLEKNFKATKQQFDNCQKELTAKSSDFENQKANYEEKLSNLKEQHSIDDAEISRLKTFLENLSVEIQTEREDNFKLMEELHIKVSHLERNLKTVKDEAEHKNSMNKTEIDKKNSEIRELLVNLLKESEKKYSNLEKNFKATKQQFDYCQKELTAKSSDFENQKANYEEKLSNLKEQYSIDIDKKSSEITELIATCSDEAKQIAIPDENKETMKKTIENLKRNLNEKILLDKTELKLHNLEKGSKIVDDYEFEFITNKNIKFPSKSCNGNGNIHPEIKTHYKYSNCPHNPQNKKINEIGKAYKKQIDELQCQIRDSDLLVDSKKNDIDLTKNTEVFEREIELLKEKYSKMKKKYKETKAKLLNQTEEKDEELETEYDNLYEKYKKIKKKYKDLVKLLFSNKTKIVEFEEQSEESDEEEEKEIGYYSSDGKRNNRPVFRVPCGTPFIYNPGNTKHYIYGRERKNIRNF